MSIINFIMFWQVEKAKLWTFRQFFLPKQPMEIWTVFYYVSTLSILRVVYMIELSVRHCL